MGQTRGVEADYQAAEERAALRLQKAEIAVRDALNEWHERHWLHASDCATHDAPAEEVRACTCPVDKARALLPALMQGVIGHLQAKQII